MDSELKPEILPPFELLSTFEGINIAAPMVRYSKLPFRHLVSLYDVHITHTPMIISKEFSRSAAARLTDFSTSAEERGSFWLVEKTAKSRLEDGTLRSESRFKRKVRGSLIAQFAASDPQVFADACELIYPHVDGIDLNCGCPQTWAYQEHIGSWLLRQPNHVRDLIRAAKDRLGWKYPISLKIRVDNELKRTDQLVQTAIHAGASHVTIHGRTRHQSSGEPVSLPSIAFAVDSAKGAIPVVANGDAWSITDAQEIRKVTGAQGVMSARGLLANPTLFSGTMQTPPQTINRFVQLSIDYGLIFTLFHRHLGFMLESQLTRSERLHFNALASYASVLDQLEVFGFYPTESPIQT